MVLCVEWLDPDGNTVSTIAALIPEKQDGLYVAAEYTAVFAKDPDCVGSTLVALDLRQKSEEPVDRYLEFNGVTVGPFRLHHVADCWYIQDTGSGKYVAVKNNSVVSSVEPYPWKYDGGFYTEFGGALAKSTRYLSVDSSSVKLSAAPVDAFIYEPFAVMEHEYICVDQGNGTHLEVCVNCGKSSAVAHDFKGGVCVCGAHEEKGEIVGVDVEVKAFSLNTLWIKRTLYYTAFINVRGENVQPSLIEYNLNNSGWQSGSSPSSVDKITDLQIRVTDETGAVTLWYFDGSDTTKQ